ncbi:hypothetical protein [Rhodoflexus caldus]|uniref:hypothetical protein n=1 Tax=Rhodoflexus caldus TaxID=2891236 RepID=UPI00202A5366|nr:hypothetical protein [Rhodoflexus caldus]
MQEKIIAILNQRPFQASLVLHLILFGLVYSIFTPFYQTNDDVLMMLIVRGISVVTEPSEYVLFMNVLLGRFLKNLFLLYPDFDWYSFFMVSCLFVSFTVLGYLFFKYLKNTYILLYFLIFVFCIEIYILLNLQFTIVASITALAGMLTLCQTNIIPPRDIVISTLCILISTMIRYQSTLLIFILLLPFIIISFYHEKLESISRYFKIIVSNIIIAFVFFIYSDADYKNYSNDYIYFKSYIVKITDQNLETFYNEKEFMDILNSARWSKNDFEMIKNWFFMDKNLYNIKSFKKITNKKHLFSVNFNLLSVKSYFFLYEIFSSKISFFMISVALGLFFIFPNKKDGYITSCLTIVVLVILVVFIRYTMKWPPERVLIPMFITAISVILFSYRKLNIQNICRWKLHVYLLTALIALYSGASLIQDQYNNSIYISSYNDSLKKFCNRIPNGSLVVGWGVGFPYENILPFESISYLKHFYTYPLGAFQRADDQMKILYQYHIGNIYYDIGNNDKIFLMVYSDKEKHLLKTYVKEHYNFNTEFLVVDRIGPRQLLKIIYKQ